MIKKCLFFLCGGLLILSGCTKDKPSSNIDLDTLPQKALNISEKFYDLSEPVYKDNNIVLELRLTPEGMGYVETSLFKEDYLINVDIFITQDEKNIFSKENIEWNLAEDAVKELRFPISDNVVETMSILFDKQEKEEEIFLSYRVDIFSKDDDSFVLRAIGRLDRK